MGTQVDKLITAGEIAQLSKRMGKTSLVFNRFQYRIHGKNSKLITGCTCTCKTKLKANLQYEILSKADLSCVPNPAGTVVTVKLENCRKRVTDECMCSFMQFIKNNCPLCGRI